MNSCLIFKLSELQGIVVLKSNKHFSTLQAEKFARLRKLTNANVNPKNSIYSNELFDNKCDGHTTKSKVKYTVFPVLHKAASYSFCPDHD